jgi:hypothetical protein
MDLGTASTALIGRYDGCSVGELLTELGATVKGKHQLEVREWVAIVAWADQNLVGKVEGAATVLAGVVDTGVPIAGPGAPLVSEFALMELIAVLGRSPDGGADACRADHRVRLAPPERLRRGGGRADRAV